METIGDDARIREAPHPTRGEELSLDGVFPDAVRGGEGLRQVGRDEARLDARPGARCSDGPPGGAGSGHRDATKGSLFACVERQHFAQCMH